MASNENNLDIDQARLISRWLLVSRVTLSIAAVLLLDLAAISVGGLITVLVGVIFVSLIIAFVWAKIDKKSLQDILNKLKELNSGFSGKVQSIIMLEALLFFISLYLSVYATLALFGLNSLLSVSISYVAMFPMFVLYVSYLQKNNIVAIYNKVHNIDIASNNRRSDKVNNPRIPLTGQILLLLLLEGLIAFSFLNPTIFAAITAVVAGSFDLMLVRATLVVFFLLILIYANTPNNEKVAGLLFGGFSLITTIMTGVAVVNLFAFQGFVLSAAASVVVYGLIILVAGFYAVISYDFNCKYDYCYYNSISHEPLYSVELQSLGKDDKTVDLDVSSYAVNDVVCSANRV
jgi:hypothetical protein